MIWKYKKRRPNEDNNVYWGICRQLWYYVIM